MLLSAEKKVNLQECITCFHSPPQHLICNWLSWLHAPTRRTSPSAHAPNRHIYGFLCSSRGIAVCVSDLPTDGPARSPSRTEDVSTAVMFWPFLFSFCFVCSRFEQVCSACEYATTHFGDLIGRPLRVRIYSYQ